MIAILRRVGRFGMVSAALSYIAILGFVGCRQRSMIYFPDRYTGDALPASFREAGARGVSLRAADGVKLEAWWFPPDDDTSPVLLWCHGNAGDIRGRGFEARQWQRMGVGVMLFDYHGFGASEGSPSEQAFYLDGAAAFDYLTDTAAIAPRRIILFGRSLGGGVASWLAASRPAGGLILESSFTSLTDRAREEYPYLPVGLILTDRFPTLGRADSISMPVMIVHGEADRTIGVAHSRRLAAAFGARAETWYVLGADHNNLVPVAGRDYYTKLKNFMDRALGAVR